MFVRKQWGCLFPGGVWRVSFKHELLSKSKPAVGAQEPWASWGGHRRAALWPSAALLNRAFKLTTGELLPAVQTHERCSEVIAGVAPPFNSIE